LRSLNDFTVQLGRRSLVEPGVLLESTRSDSVEQSKRTESIDVSGVLGHFKRNLDVRLSAQVVDLGGLDLRNDVNKVGCGGAQCQCQSIVSFDCGVTW
jgi:hypothetical protein